MDFLIIGLVLLALVAHMGIINAADSFKSDTSIEKEKE
jgi:hypothetical protein